MLQIPLIKDLLCYVCGKPVGDHDSVCIGGGMRRHLKCKPGSRKWLKRQGQAINIHVSEPDAETKPTE